MLKYTLLPFPSHTVDLASELVQANFDVVDNGWLYVFETKEVARIINKDLVGFGQYNTSKNVRTTAVDTTFGALDDIIVGTATCIITLPETSARVLTVKRQGSGNVTIEPFGIQTIDGLANLTLNINNYSVDLKQLSDDNWIIL